MAAAKVNYSTKKNVVYTPKNWPEAVRADVYQPVVEGVTPAVLLIHGGSWAQNDNRYQMRAIAKKLVRRGYLVVNATYRLAPKWHYPSPVEDLRQALCWMRDHAEQLNIDPHRVAVYGYSAGGHLAELVGFQPPPEGISIRAIVAGAAPHDLTLKPDFPVVSQFLGVSYTENPEVYHQASPLNNVSSEIPALFIYQGTKDKLVPPEHTYRLLPQLEKYDARHQIHWVKGRGHISTFIFPRKAVRDAMIFLEKELTD